MITEDQLELLLEEQKRRPGELLGKVAESLGFINDEQLAQALAEQMGMRVVNLGELKIAARRAGENHRADGPNVPRGADRVCRQHAHRWRCAIRKSSPFATSCARFLGYDIKAMVATERDVLKALEKFYASGTESVESLVSDMEDDEELRSAAEAMDTDGPLDLTSVEAMADSAPVRKLLNMVLLDGHPRPCQRLAL